MTEHFTPVTVALVRHVLPREDPGRFGHLVEKPDGFDLIAQTSCMLLVEEIAARAARFYKHTGHSDQRASRVESAIMEEAKQFLDSWRLSPPIYYWNDHDPAQSLLVSAEAVAGKGSNSMAKSTPNSMRGVSLPCSFGSKTIHLRSQRMTCNDQA